MKFVPTMLLVTAAVMSGYATHSYAAKPVASRGEPIPSSLRLDWSLQLPEEEHVAYQGVARFDDVRLSQNGMLYPSYGGGAADLGAGIIAHAITNKAMRNAQKKAIQEKADEVLAPYRSFLEHFSNDDLFHRSLPLTVIGASKRIIGADQSSGAAYRVHSSPVYEMTQDQTALVLENEIAIYPPGEMKSPVYANRVHVVMPAQRADDLQAYWSADGGEPLKSESAKLLAASLDLALNDAAAARDGDAEFQTVRFMEGKLKRVERAQVLDRGGGRLLLRSLRGTLMSVPEVEAASPAPGNSCEGAGGGQMMRQGDESDSCPGDSEAGA